jgi:hypothetical protein
VSPRRLGELTPARRRRAVAETAAGTLVLAAVIITFYYLLPLDTGRPDQAAVVRLCVGGVVFLAAMAVEVRRILRADLPQLRAVEAAVVALALFLVLFASAYVSLANSGSSNFNEHVDRTGGLYFAIVTLGTVGYGDIVPTSDFARVLVSVQIMVDLVFLAVLLRLVVGAARLSLHRSGGPGGPPYPGAGPPYPGAGPPYPGAGPGDDGPPLLR